MTREDVLTAVLCLAAGVAIGWAIRSNRDEAVVETPAPEVVQEDGSRVLAREPDATPPAAPHQLPAGGKRVRAVSVTVQPAEASCGPVRFDFSLVRFDDGSARVVASSPDGRVTGGVDVPIAPMFRAERRPWAAGVSYGTSLEYGVWIQRDFFDRVRVGAEVRADEVRATAGWAFGSN